MSEPPLPGTRRQLLLAKYGPLVTVPMYFGFSTEILLPNEFSKIFGSEINSIATSSLCFGSHLGIGVYFFTSKHLRNANIFTRLLYSVYGSTLFNFATVLMMSVIRSMFRSSDGLRSIVGLSTAGGLLLIGKRYVDFVDQVFDGIRFRSPTQ